MRKSSKVLITAAVVIGLVGAGGGAYAWWSGTAVNTGSVGTAGTVSTVASNPVTVNQTNAAISNLAPGVSGALTGNFTNSGSQSVTVSNVVIGFTISGAAGTCTTSNYTITQPVISPAQVITTGTANGSWGGSVMMNNLSSNQNGCLGATLNFSYTVS